MRLFDTHSHIQGPEFESDREAVLQRAHDAGLIGLLVLGTDLATSEQAVALAEAHEDVFAACGYHPHDAEQADEPGLARIAELASLPCVVAVGEIGLDFYRDLSPRPRQIEILRRQLDLAAELGKPVAVHCRDAHERLLPIVEEWSGRLSGGFADARPLGVLHYFSGGAELAWRYIELGFVISIHGSVTYPKNERLRSVARTLPLETLVVETDSPYGAPQSHRGRRNEPAYLGEAVALIAELRGEPAERVADVTTENALRLFGTRVSRPGAVSAP